MFSAISTTLFARGRIPVEPSAQCLQTKASVPLSATYRLSASISAFVSLTKWFIATTTGIPNDFTFSICLPRFAQPRCTASIFSVLRSFLETMPPFIFIDLTVATITAASGFIPAFLHFILTNFSAPRSAPKPASVTT